MIAEQIASRSVRRVLGALGLQSIALGGLAAQQASATPVAAVATRRLERGVIIGDSDITFVPAKEESPRTRFASAGWITRRVIQQGELLRAPAVVPAPDVRAAAPVAVVTEGAVQIRVSGVAMEDGVVGDTILVSLGTGSRIRARIDEPGRVVALGSGRARQ
ncbi:MAG: flagellar basal body P-ring formation chaperone FlgA [Gemmatimonadota bacterium]